MNDRINERQRRFVAEYLKDPNGATAAERAGYAKGSAAKTASQLLARPDIAALVARGEQPAAAKRQITADRVLEELGRMAFSDIRRYVDWGPNGVTLRDKDALDSDDAAAIADIEAKGTDGKIGRIKLYDKLAALNALARHLGMTGGKAATSQADKARAGDEARAELRRRLLRIAKGE